MKYQLFSSPFDRQRRTTRQVMAWVIACCGFGLIAQWYYFGYGVFVQLFLSCTTAIITESIFIACRKRPILPTLKDNTALLTGVLIGLSIPPLAPWWLAVIGTLFAIVIAKQMYGGVGQNLFNPAMTAYVAMIVAFPKPMTTWLVPEPLRQHVLTWHDTLSAIGTGHTLEGFSLHQLNLGIDGITLATPLDSIKTALTTGITSHEAMTSPIFTGFAGMGWAWINVAFLIGGLILLKKRIIRWHLPVSFLLGLLVASTIGYIIDADAVGSPLIQLFSGATMMGAFFIVTDPVTAATSPKGRLIFGALIGILTYLIRQFGGFPDGLAFAVLLGNLCVPLIDHYTRPTVYGHTKQTS